MLDFARIMDYIGGLLSPGGVAETLQQGGLSDLLQNAGINASMLDGLTQTEILDLLGQHGIDLSALPTGDLQELLQSFGANEGLGSLVTSMLEGETGGER